MDLVLKLAKFAVISGGIYVVIAVGLILSQWPGGALRGDGLHFEKLTLDHEPIAPERFMARDGGFCRKV